MNRPPRNYPPTSIRIFQIRLLLAMIAAPFLSFSVLSVSAAAGDWPQILGPQRNGHAIGERLLDKWPEGGPKLLWQHKVGRGYSGAAIQDDRVIVFHRVGDEEIVEAIRLADGERLWRQSYTAHFQGQIFPDQNGPLCVPVISGSTVFVFGAGGDLRALSFETGKKLWERALYREHRQRGGRTDFGYFGAGSSPIVEGDRILVNVGGFKGAGIMAFDTGSGKTLWKATDEGPSYSAPVATTLGNVRHVVFVTRYNAVSIDPDNGEVRFRFPFGQRGPTVNAASPIVAGDLLFATASYGEGAQLTRFNADSAKQIWANDEALSSQYNTPVLHNGHLYGTDGRADVGVGALRCVELKTGKIAWSEKGFGVAAPILADGKLLIVTADGKLVLATPRPDSFQARDTAQLTNGVLRALPALAHGRLLVRDESALKCFAVGETQSPNID